MKQLWHIQVDNGEEIILSDTYLVSKREQELRDEGLAYKTDYYEDGKLITLRS